MLGQEAKRICEKLENITRLLLNDCDSKAFYEMGRLTEELDQIVKIDQVSFNPTVKEDELKKKIEK